MAARAGVPSHRCCADARSSPGSSNVTRITISPITNPSRMASDCGVEPEVRAQEGADHRRDQNGDRDPDHLPPPHRPPKALPILPRPALLPPVEDAVVVALEGVVEELTDEPHRQQQEQCGEGAPGELTPSVLTWFADGTDPAQSLPPPPPAGAGGALDGSAVNVNPRTLCSGVLTADSVELAAPVADSEALPGVGVAPAVRVGVAVGLTVGRGVPVGVAVGLCRRRRGGGLWGSPWALALALGVGVGQGRRQDVALDYKAIALGAEAVHATRARRRTSTP